MSVNDFRLHFKSTVHECIARYVLQKVKKNQCSSPSITCELLQLKRCIKRLGTSRLKASHIPLQFLRSELYEKMRQSKYNFLHVKMHNFLASDPSKFWRHWTQKDLVRKIRSNQSEINDPYCIASAFNDYFSSVLSMDSGQGAEFQSPCLKLPDLSISVEEVFAPLLN